MSMKMIMLTGECSYRLLNKFVAVFLFSYIVSLIESLSLRHTLYNQFIVGSGVWHGVSCIWDLKKSSGCLLLVHHMILF